jgi:hypothetical protein
MAARSVANKRYDNLTDLSGYYVSEPRQCFLKKSREQSGPINAVGLNLYMQMLNETVEEIKTKQLEDCKNSFLEIR